MELGAGTTHHYHKTRCDYKKYAQKQHNKLSFLFVCWFGIP